METEATTATQSSGGSIVRPAEASGTFLIGDILVRRLGFGTMQLTGAGVWGAPANHSEAITVL
jgi:pyridoxine 4-dehydrogenase